MIGSVSLIRAVDEAPDLLHRLNQSADHTMNLQQQLRRDYSPDVIQAAMTLIAGRRAAAGLLPGYQELWLTPVSLQQSTALPVARHKASRFPQGEAVHDLCCGIGVDSMALLKRGAVVSVDNSEVLLEFCRRNQQVWGTAESHSTELHDVTEYRYGDLVHVDPDRRVHSDRPAKRLEQYVPDLEWMRNLAGRSDCSGAMKLGPASNFLQKFPGCEIELISLDGECREATVWFGDLADRECFRATVLSSGERAAESVCGHPLEAWCSQADAIRRYIFDPDPAVVRSGLPDLVGEQLGLSRLDREEEYLTGDDVPDSALVTAFEVVAILPNNPKLLARELKSCAASSYEIKCRHLRIDADVVRRRLPSGDNPPCTIIFARVAGKAKIAICRRVTDPIPRKAEPGE